VTLTGHCRAYAEKLPPPCGRTLYVVKAVANDLKVQQFLRALRDDSDIATASLHILEWNGRSALGECTPGVENGWVTLDGRVDYD